MMAKLEEQLYGDFDSIFSKKEDGIVSGSMSASLEDSSDFSDGSARCSVRVFEQ